MRESLERHQIWIYFVSIACAAALSLAIPNTSFLAPAISPALSLMLFVTFLQVPMRQIGQGLHNARFLGALLLSNFIAIPAFVFVLLQFASETPLLQLGLLMVLLTPCIDYVITFAHLGRADARLLLGATPLLLVVQMALLPAYLHLFLGKEAAQLMQAGPFIDAFVWMIALPLLCAAFVQNWADRKPKGQRVSAFLSIFPVPATASVLFLVVAATLPVLEGAGETIRAALPIYALFSLVAPMIGWLIARAFHLTAPAGRAIAFSSATRNSLVILPLALAVPDAGSLLATVILTQTLVELTAQLFYIRVLPRIFKTSSQNQSEKTAG